MERIACEHLAFDKATPNRCVLLPLNSEHVNVLQNVGDISRSASKCCLTDVRATRFADQMRTIGRPSGVEESRTRRKIVDRRLNAQVLEWRVSGNVLVCLQGSNLTFFNHLP